MFIATLSIFLSYRKPAHDKKTPQNILVLLYCRMTPTIIKMEGGLASDITVELVP